MRTIGLIGGMSWESTAVYYRLLNEAVRQSQGNLSSAEILLHSVDFARIVGWQKTGDWDAAADELADIGNRLTQAGADCILICTNTMHLVADRVAERLSVPLINIIDSTADAIKAGNFKRPLLFATRYTMEHGFYTQRMREQHGISVLVPDQDDRDAIHKIIFDELCQGIIRPESRAVYLDIVERGVKAGADCVILGCTEIGLLVKAKQVAIPCFDSTVLHAQAATDFALETAVSIQTPVILQSFLEARQSASW
jgi:aspartate racemase